jgi:two-component system, chemotaxis family, response regulator Rcp1
MSEDWQPIEILLVEDNPGDVDLTKEALREAKVSNRLHVAEDGAEAIDFLFKRESLSVCPGPTLSCWI